MSPSKRLKKIWKRVCQSDALKMSLRRFVEIESSSIFEGTEGHLLALDRKQRGL